MRTIIHVDMDAFFAAIEQRDHPELRGRPVVVGAPPDQRGVVSTASYEARAHGIHSAMPSRTAYRLCPRAVFLPVRMQRYQEVSREVFAILQHYTPLVEPVSIDEAFLDVTGALRSWAAAADLARDLKQRVRSRVGLTISAGIATNKFLAKLASELSKPDGLFCMPASEKEVVDFLAPLPITKIWGVGKSTAGQLRKFGLTAIGQLQVIPSEQLERILGKAFARHVSRLARGLDDSPVLTAWSEKSLSQEETFLQDCRNHERLRQTLLEQVEIVGQRLRAAGKWARTVQVKLRYGDFTTITRQISCPIPVQTDRDLLRQAFIVFDRLNLRRPVRLLGFGVSNLVTGARDTGLALELQLESAAPNRREKDRSLDRAVDRVRDRYGREALRRGNWRATTAQS